MKKKISAFLGPTNTGKTYTAIQSLLKYNSGVIGFPLRLLARENFELAKKFLPENKIVKEIECFPWLCQKMKLTSKEKGIQICLP